MADPSIFSGMPLLLESASLSGSTQMHSRHLRVVRMKFDNDDNVVFGDGEIRSPADVLLAVVKDEVEEVILRDVFRRQELAAPTILKSPSSAVLAQKILDSLGQSLTKSAAREAAAAQRLLRMRQEAEETREALQRLRRDVLRSLPSQKLSIIWDRPPLGEDASLYFTGAFEFVSHTSVETFGLTAVGIHFAGRRLSPDDRIEVQILGEESDRVLGAWRLPAKEIPDGPQWLILDCPLPIAGARETVLLTIKGALSAESWLALSQAADVETESEDTHPSAALRLFGATTPRLVPSPWWNWDAIGTVPSAIDNLAMAVAIPGKSWLGVEIIGSAFALDAREKREKLRLSAGAAAMLVFPNVPLTGFAALIAQIRLLSGASGMVTAALALLPADEDYPRDVASACRAAIQWSDAQRWEAAHSTLTMVLPQNPPDRAHVALALRHMGGRFEDFVVLACEGVSLTPAVAPRLGTPADIFSAGAEVETAQTTFENVRLDEIFDSENYRHLDLSLEGARDGDAVWSHVKFKLFEDKGQCGLEFRAGSAWPVCFKRWPGQDFDDFGRIFRIEGARGLTQSIESLPEKEDRELLIAIEALLPHIVQTLATNDAIEPGATPIWLEIARRMRAPKNP